MARDDKSKDSEASAWKVAETKFKSWVIFDHTLAL